MTDDCLFCRAASGELDVNAIAESADAMAFLDLHPRAPGHTLVIPRTHAPTLAELPSDKVGPLFELVQRVAALLEDKLEPDGMTIGINQGDVAGQGIGHLHVHLMPRFRGDGGSNIHAVVNNHPTPAQQELLSTLTP